MITNPLYALMSATMASAYGRQTRPETMVVDFLSTWSYANTGASQRLRFDPNSGCAYAQPLFVPHDQLSIPLTGTPTSPFLAYAFQIGTNTTLPPIGPQVYVGTDGTYELEQGLASSDTPEMIGGFSDASELLEMAYKTGSPPVKINWYPKFTNTPTGPELFEAWSDNHFHAMSWFGNHGMDADFDTLNLPYCQGFTAFMGGTLAIPFTKDGGTIVGDGRPTKDPSVENPYGPIEPSVELYFQLGTDMDTQGVQTLCLRLSHAKSLDLWWLPTWYPAEGSTARSQFFASGPNSNWVLIKSNVGAGDMGTAVGMGTDPIQQNPNSPSSMVPVAVTFLNGVLCIYVGSSTVPFILDFCGAAPSLDVNGEQQSIPIIPTPTGYPVISAIGVAARAFQSVSYWIHPMKFLRSAPASSPWNNLGCEIPTKNSEYEFVVSGIPEQALGESFLETDYPIAPVPGAGGSVKAYLLSMLIDGLPDLLEHGTNPFELGSITINGVEGIGQQLRYVLTINNDGAANGGGWWANEKWSDLTAVVTRISSHVMGAEISPTNTDSYYHSYALNADGPKQFSVSATFNHSDMSITSEMSAVLDNRHGQHAGSSGQRAILLDLGYDIPIANAVRVATDRPQGATRPLYRVFTGIANRYSYSRPDTATCNFSIHGVDRNVLFEKPIAAPLDMDGWNHYNAMRYCAEYAGVRRSSIMWNAMCGDTPYSASPYDDSPYFLPFGNGMHPWTPVYRTQSTKQLMGHIRASTGFMLFFDPYGNLHYQPYRYVYGNGPYPNAVASFTESPTGPQGASLSEYWNFEATVNMASIRNQIILVGVDSFGKCWSPVVVKLEDAASIAGGTAFNVLGYPMPFIQVSSQFASLPYALNVAQRMMAFFSLPDYSATFECWMRPDLYPGDIITIMDVPSGFDGGNRLGFSVPLPFTVMSVHHSANAGGGVHPRTQVNAQFLFGRGYA